MKRAQGETSGSPPAKKQFVTIPAVSVGAVSTEEEMNMKVLCFQNKKLAEKIEERKAEEEKLKEEMEALKLQRKFDLDIISVVHRHWMQLDEDVKNMLQRYERGTEENFDQTITGELPSVSYLEHLSSLDPAAIREEVDRRTESSKNAVQKLLQFMQRRQNVCAPQSTPALLPEGAGASEQRGTENEEEIDKEKDAAKDEESGSVAVLPDISKEMQELQADNKRLEELITSMQQKLNTTSLEFSELRDKYAVAQKEISQLNTQVQDAEYDLQKAAHRVEKLVKRLTEVEMRAKQVDGGESSGGVGAGSGSGTGASSSQMDEVKSEVEELRELVEKRLDELQALHEKYTSSQQEIEKLKLEASQIPESVIVQSSTYKCLQLQFSVLFGEATQLRQQLDDTRRVLSNCKTQNLLQMEQIESDNGAMQKKFKAEVNELHEALLQAKRDYDMLRLEFEQNLKSTEQTIPMTKEMHHMNSSLQSHNQQLKGEVNRYKRKFTESQEQINKLQEDLSNLKNSEVKAKKIKEVASGKENVAESAESAEKGDKEEEEGELEEGEDLPVKSGEAEQQLVKNLQSELKKAQESQKEMKLLLDVYKGAAKDLRDRAELLTVENRLKDEIEELKIKVEEQDQELKKYKGALADEEAIRRLKVAEETIDQLQKNLAATKQEEDALLAEMEFTGQAFEEMQEQNVRLLQQLREKDDANLKLMSERIKANQIQKQLREEKDLLADHVTSLNTYRETQTQAIRKMEEREKILSSAVASMEKEMTLRQQVMDFHKRKAVECAQSVQELKLRLEGLQHQTQEIQNSLAEKTRCCEEEQFRARRVQEECLSLRRKVEKQKKMDMYGAADEVLLEEIREYKAKLTCPCCNIRKKDAILTKCFHVFCFECLKTRYDTRQRKCPKCNATFGNNDYHKMYLS